MKLINYQEAGELLRVPVGTLYAWVHAGQIPHIRLGERTVRFDVEALEAWVIGHRREPPSLQDAPKDG